VLNETVQKLDSHILLSEKTADLPQEKAKYVYRMLSDKSATFINENFDYTVKLFDKTEEEKLEQYKKQTKTKAASVDRPIVEQTQKTEQPKTESHVNSLYMNELNKF
jgi:hypothetical protein